MNKLLPYNNKGHHGYIDHKGNVVIPFIYKDAKFYSEGLAPVLTEDDKWGYIDEEGSLVFTGEWFAVHEFHEGFALVVDLSEKCGFIDKQGNIAIPFTYLFKSMITNNINSYIISPLFIIAPINEIINIYINELI